MEAKTTDSSLFNIIGYTILILFSIVCIFPFLLLLSGSFTSNESIIVDGYHLIPKVFSWRAYDAVLVFPGRVIKAYMVTTSVTVIGSFTGLLLMTMAGYVLQRKDFKYRNKLSFFIYFTTLFGGGLVPWYILMTKYLHLTNSYLALIIPGLMTPFLIILMRSFIKAAVPEELSESAKIDGANDFRIYYRIVLPLSMPGIATVGLFLALQYWNSWFLSSMFITEQAKYELQYFLYNIINAASFANGLGVSTGVTLGYDMPTESMKLAMAMITTGPILLLYPFIQRYFVKGLTIGAVKG
ncbi:carbohydrate ABC transporter permease [Paenibacillus psychroresistens]|uniref:Carbohydrate ABC transporter permease n=1 Tax=Paenibacillus psychroresistens TaxID=1778678 RepID=A0A6B8RS60_9BACL|nr:carbohydrate ABC transporter permease [Paenibacillus psychroresistens]QGQ98176.1 carbohydrate ABC transporter permease [Paenibacillus psychroresistens]